MGGRTVSNRLGLRHRQVHHLNASSTMSDPLQRFELQFAESKSAVLTIVRKGKVVGVAGFELANTCFQNKPIYPSVEHPEIKKAP